MREIGTDSNLAVQCLLAAQQIDRRSGPNFNRAILTDFGQDLLRASGIDAVPRLDFLMVDPVATEVFSEAVSKASDQRVSDIVELVAETKKLISALLRGGEGLSSEQLGELKLFCLALHRSIMARRMPTIFDREAPFDNEFRFAG